MSPSDALRPRRHATVSVDVGGVLVGSAHPVVVQSMTNTDTADADATAIQVARLAHAGSQLVRVTVNTDQAAAAIETAVRIQPHEIRNRRCGARSRAKDKQLAACGEADSFHTVSQLT